MLLTIDVGNTNTVLGVFREAELLAHWRLTTAQQQTVDEYGILTRNLFSLAGLDPQAIRGIIVSSVVPPLNSTVAELLRPRGHGAVALRDAAPLAALIVEPVVGGADALTLTVAALIDLIRAVGLTLSPGPTGAHPARAGWISRRPRLYQRHPADR